MIPKILHCVWFGQNEFSEKEKRCVESWKKYLPEYKIMVWNEKSFDLNQNRYVKEAYILKKYAFVSDYVRLWALYHYGGIYMDTDVEVIKPFDDFLDKSVFLSFETSMVTIATCGAEKNNLWIKELLDEYEERKFLLPNGAINIVTNLRYVTNSCQRHGLIRNEEYQVLDNNVEVFEKEFFCPEVKADGSIVITENTVCIHHYSASWVTKNNYIWVRIGRRIKYLLFYWALYKFLFDKEI